MTSKPWRDGRHEKLTPEISCHWSHYRIEHLYSSYVGEICPLQQHKVVQREGKRILKKRYVSVMKPEPCYFSLIHFPLTESLRCLLFFRQKALLRSNLFDGFQTFDRPKRGKDILSGCSCALRRSASPPASPDVDVKFCSSDRQPRGPGRIYDLQIFIYQSV